MAFGVFGVLAPYVFVRATLFIVLPLCIPTYMRFGQRLTVAIAYLLYVGIAVFVYWLSMGYRDWRKNIDGVPLEEAIGDSHNDVAIGHLAAKRWPPTCDISLIVPAYNEQERLPIMLKETAEYIATRKDTTFELIIVDDGSKDGTFNIAKAAASDLKASNLNVRAIKLRRNRGKGFAVRTGMLCGQGKALLMVDADAATDINDLIKLEQELENGYDAVFGSRAHLQKEATANRSFLRNVCEIYFIDMNENSKLQSKISTSKLFETFSICPMFQYCFYI